MDWVHALILGIVQGVTEYLPISSSGHLILLPYLLHWPDQGLDFDVAVNTGSLCALMFYFRKDLTRLFLAFLATFRANGWENNFDGRMAWWIGIGTIPVGLAGLTFKHYVETVARSPLVVGSTAIIFGLLLLYADRAGRRERPLTELRGRDAIIIGCAQALALIPGTSRSGITITAGLLRHLDGESAARFSFLLSVPASFLAALLEIVKWSHETHPAGTWLPMGVGFVAAAITSIAVIHGLLLWIRNRSLAGFGIYRILLGIFLFSFL